MTGNKPWQVRPVVVTPTQGQGRKILRAAISNGAIGAVASGVSEAASGGSQDEVVAATLQGAVAGLAGGAVGGYAAVRTASLVGPIIAGGATEATVGIGLSLWFKDPLNETVGGTAGVVTSTAIDVVTRMEPEFRLATTGLSTLAQVSGGVVDEVVTRFGPK